MVKEVPLSVWEVEGHETLSSFQIFSNLSWTKFTSRVPRGIEDEHVQGEAMGGCESAVPAPRVLTTWREDAIEERKEGRRLGRRRGRRGMQLGGREEGESAGASGEGCRRRGRR